MRLAKRIRLFYNFRVRDAQLQRPSCVLLHNCYVCEDGLFHIHFSCLSHEMTSWRETYNVGGDHVSPTQATLASPAWYSTICTMDRTEHQERPPPIEEEEICEEDFEVGEGEQCGSPRTGPT